MKITPYQEIRKHLEESDNPLFLFDDDPDGLCSYLLLKKYISRGKGLVVKSSPELSHSYLKQVSEIKPDCIFILDKPLVCEEFFIRCKVPIIWIDHHDLQNYKSGTKGVKYYNPKQFNESFPVSYFCYKITESNSWISVIGSLNDWYKPPILTSFSKQYPNILPDPTKTIPEILFEDTPFSKLCKIFRFVLKGNDFDIERSLSNLEKIKSPDELLGNKTKESKSILTHYNRVNEEYQLILKKALKTIPENDFLTFIYTNQTISISSYLSNELIYHFPNTVLVVGREKDDRINMSIRSPNKPIPEALKKALSGLDGSGGGHTNACGSNISKKDFPELIKRLKENLK